MLFNSGTFLLFFPVVTLLYFVLPKRGRWIWLLISSYYFYMCWEPVYALLIAGSTVLTYLSGRMIERAGSAQNGEYTPVQRRKRKLAVAFSFVSNLLILVFFKYFDFLADNLVGALRLIGVEVVRPAFSVLLPVGISFYTFQALSYTMDVYRGNVEVEHNLFRYALYVSFFPQLVAGPIERSKNLLDQLKQPHRFSFERARCGLLLMLWGYFLKMVLADRIAMFVDTVYGNPSEYGGWFLIVATVLFAFQIYCDFAGYSTIAMGASQILGIQLMENFHAPYLSRSVSEFWRRWHVSLSTWFRDYLYIPLGGNRKGKWRKQLNLMIVFLVSGLWHGAAWSYLLWGGLNGLYQVAGEWLKPLRDRVVKLLRLNRNSLGHRLLQTASTFLLVDFSWIFFRANSLRGPQGALVVLEEMLHADNAWIFWTGDLFNCGLDAANFLLLTVGIAVLLFADVCKRRGMVLREHIARQDGWFQCVLIAFSVLFLLLFGVWGPGYDATSFIYFQF